MLDRNSIKLPVDLMERLFDALNPAYSIAMLVAASDATQEHERQIFGHLAEMIGKALLAVAECRPAEKGASDA